VKGNCGVAAGWMFTGVVTAIVGCAGRVIELGGADGLDVTNGTIAEDAFPNDASSVSESDGGGTNVCFTPGPLQAVVTLSDLGGQWVTGCDPGAPPLPLIVNGAANTSAGIPADTVGFEIDPSTRAFYPLVAADGGFARATGPGSVWWVLFPYAPASAIFTMPNGSPEEALAVQVDPGTDAAPYSALLGAWGVLYHPPTDHVLASLTLAATENAYAVTLVPPAAVGK
jgi:hypothetical protein